MQVTTKSFDLSTNGFTDIIDITPDVKKLLRESNLHEGNITVFIAGSTAGITTIEHEPGLLKDIPEAFDKIAPFGPTYHHDAAWGDGNGSAHVRAAMLGPSCTVPFQGGKLILGTWQQIVLIDFDNRPRQRTIVVQFMGQ